MSVYKYEKTLFLKESIDSMLNQTLKPSDFVIVCDGTLTKELDILIEKFNREYPELIHIVKL